MYQNVVSGVSFKQISEISDICFNIKIKKSAAHNLKKVTAEYYKGWYNKSIRKIQEWRFIHCDETSIRTKSGKGYVWVFTNLYNVIYVFKKDRKTDFIKNYIKGFDGIFISDFYAGFNSLKCLQQKCLIHLIRDINTALYKYQQDVELQLIANEFSYTLRNMISTIDKYGSKKRHLNKHKNDVEKFYEKIINKEYKSESAKKVVKRFKRFKNSLFTFLDFDGISWNNNCAEHSLKFIASYRKRINGSFTDQGIEDYLILFSLYKTCKNRNINMLNFLLSKEKDVDNYEINYNSKGKKIKK